MRSKLITSLGPHLPVSMLPNLGIMVGMLIESVVSHRQPHHGTV
jgi:hypothetical protein